MLRVAFALALFFVTTPVAFANETYRISGSDELHISGTRIDSITSYNGLQSLSVTPLGNGIRRFRADAAVRIISDGSSVDTTASAELTLNRNGEQKTLRNDDPGYLTVLTQPFAVALDKKTLGEVTDLRKPLPFRFSSSMTGGDLRGLLAFRGYSRIDGFETVGMTFTADGPLSGSLPGRNEAQMTGRIHLTGRAFYRRSDQLLMKLATTIVTSGDIAMGKTPSKIRVTYTRELLHVRPRPTATPKPAPTAAPTASAIPSPTPSPTPAMSPGPSASPAIPLPTSTVSPKALP